VLKHYATSRKVASSSPEELTSPIYLILPGFPQPVRNKHQRQMQDVSNCIRRLIAVFTKITIHILSQIKPIYTHPSYFLSNYDTILNIAVSWTNGSCDSADCTATGFLTTEGSDFECLWLQQFSLAHVVEPFPSRQIRLGYEAGYSPSTVTEIKKIRIISSTPPYVIV
jgi:hypothetical protein